MKIQGHVKQSLCLLPHHQPDIIGILLRWEEILCYWSPDKYVGDAFNVGKPFVFRLLLFWKVQSHEVMNGFCSTAINYVFAWVVLLKIHPTLQTIKLKHLAAAFLCNDRAICLASVHPLVCRISTVMLQSDASGRQCLSLNVKGGMWMLESRTTNRCTGWCVCAHPLCGTRQVGRERGAEKKIPAECAAQEKQSQQKICVTLNRGHSLPSGSDSFSPESDNRKRDVQVTVKVIQISV